MLHDGLWTELKEKEAQLFKLILERGPVTVRELCRAYYTDHRPTFPEMAVRARIDKVGQRIELVNLRIARERSPGDQLTRYEVRKL